MGLVGVIWVQLVRWVLDFWVDEGWYGLAHGGAGLEMVGEGLQQRQS